MDQLTKLYKNKAEDLAKQVKILEAKLMEAAGTATVGQKVAQEFKHEFVDPAKKWATSPVQTTKEKAKSAVDAAKSVASGTKEAAKSVGRMVTTPTTEIPAVVSKGVEVGKAAAKIAGPLAVGYWAGEGAEKVADVAMDAAGVENPMARASVKTGVGFGTWTGVGAATHALMTGAAPGAAATTGLAAAAPAAVAGAALPVVAYGAYKAGEAISDAALESETGKKAVQKATEVAVSQSGKAPTGTEEEKKAEINRQAEEIKAEAAKKRAEQEATKRGGKTEAEIEEMRRKAAERRAARPEGTKFDG